MPPASDSFDVDAVITWVDGGDPAHRAHLQAYLESSGLGNAAAASPTRFGDCGEIEFCVASLLRFAPWLRTIHIVTDAQSPAFLERLRGSALEQRVRLVDHRDFFQGFEQYLPTFSNRSIECLMWRMPGLAEHFIYLNDDFQLIRPVRKEDFFDTHGLVLRGHWRASGTRHWKQRAHLAGNALRRLLGRPLHAHAARPGSHAAQALSARLAGFADRYLQVPHVPHPMLRSPLAGFFAEHGQLLLDNVRHRLRTDGQFVTTALSAHLALASHQARVDNNLRVMRLKPSEHSARAVERDLMRAEDDAAMVFFCAQSLDLAPIAVRERVLAWLETRVGRVQPAPSG